MYVNAKGVALPESAATTNIAYQGNSYSVRNGTAQNDLFNSMTGDTMAGGLGDDSYNVWNAGSSVSERAGQGIDTVFAKYWGAATLADNVENLVLDSSGATAGTGNALSNIIIAGTIGATLNGMGGDDVLVGGSGADVFRVQAGHGSDAIVGFQSTKDAILLQGYGFTNFAQVQAAATQSGGNTNIALGNGEILQLQGIAKSGLIAADFGFRAPAAGTGSTVDDLVTLSTANRANTVNGWTVFNNVWGQGSLKEGTDFTISGSYSRGDVTGGTSFTWSFPYVTGASSTIRAYPEVAFGVPPKSIYFAGNPTDKATTFPIPLDKLYGLSATYDVSIGGTTSGFNVSYDIWLTNRPNGDKSTISNEIMVWVHKGDVLPYGTLVGTYTQGDMTAKIYHTGTYTAVIADSDKLAGTIDIAALFHKLQDMGIVSANEYVAGVELGAEIVSGVGSLTINNLELTAQSIADDGTIIVKHVTGAGATATEMPEFALDYTAGTVKEYGDTGLQTGTAVTTINADGVTIKHLDLHSRVVSTEIVTAAGNDTVSTKHYDAGSNFLGTDVTTKSADGSSTARHFDVAGVLTGSDKMLTDAKGAAWDYHYDAGGKLTGSVKTSVEGSATLTTHMDAAGKITGIDKLTINGKVASVQHLDANRAVLSAEQVTQNSDGSVRTQHFSSNFTLTGVEVANTDAGGITTETQYDAKYQALKTVYTGSVGADTITGTAKANAFHGGFGSDTLKLGANADTVYFDTAIGTDVDKLVGFSAAKDTMSLDHTIFEGLKTGVLDAASFVQGTAAKDANDYLVYDKASGKIWFDADGSGAEKAILFAQVDPNTVLTHTDFVIF